MRLAAMLWMQEGWAEFTWSAYFNHLTPVLFGLLMILLALLAGVVWRSLRLCACQQRARSGAGRFVNEVSSPLAAGDLSAAAAVASRYPQVHLARMTLAGLSAFTAAPAELRVVVARHAMARTRALQIRELGDGLATLSLTAQLTPFLGLLATVFGMLDSFRGWAAAKWYVLAWTAWSLSVALIPTALALFVAVLAAWMHKYFTERLEIFEVEMENAASELAGYLGQRALASAPEPLACGTGLLDAVEDEAKAWEVKYEWQPLLAGLYVTLMLYFASLFVRGVIYNFLHPDG